MLGPDQIHPKARAALADAFLWDPQDPSGPFGNETGREVLEAFQDLRASSPRGDALELLKELLETWEVADTDWDVVDEDAVQAVGAEDEHSLLLRDEVILALAFASLAIDGAIHLEVQRRALVALQRQTLPALLHGFGDGAARRRKAIERMREILGQRWS